MCFYLPAAPNSKEVVMLSKEYKKATAETLEQLANDIAAGAKATASLKKENKALRTQLSALQDAHDHLKNDHQMLGTKLMSVEIKLAERIKELEKINQSAQPTMRQLESLRLALLNTVRAQTK